MTRFSICLLSDGCVTHAAERRHCWSRCVRRFVLASVVITFALGGLASGPFATAAGPPHQPVKVNGITLASVPGLERAVNSQGLTDIPRDGGNPTPARCASEWNSHAPAVTLRWLGRLAPRPARIKVGTFTKNGATSRFCVLEVALGGDRLLMAYLHKREHGVQWKGVIATPLSKFGLPPSEFDGLVTAAGKVRS
jgi:hypothetical protein